MLVYILFLCSPVFIFYLFFPSQFYCSRFAQFLFWFSFVSVLYLQSLVCFIVLVTAVFPSFCVVCFYLLLIVLCFGWLIWLFSPNVHHVLLALRLYSGAGPTLFFSESLCCVDACCCPVWFFGFCSLCRRVLLPCFVFQVLLPVLMHFWQQWAIFFQAQGDYLGRLLIRIFSHHVLIMKYRDGSGTNSLIVVKVLQLGAAIRVAIFTCCGLEGSFF